MLILYFLFLCYYIKYLVESKFTKGFRFWVTICKEYFSDMQPMNMHKI
jgi:hypothetical protein